MADLIDREELRRRIEYQRYLLRHGRNRITVAMVEQQINGMPAVDAEPVRAGRWIYDRMDVVCSHCKTSFKDNIDFIQQDGKGRFVTAKRCPNCGAKMENGGT